MYDLGLDLAVTIVSLIIVGTYTWSLRGHFSSPKMPDGAKVISAAVVATTLFFLFLLWSQDQLHWAQWTGLAIEIAAGVLFWWAISASRRARLRFAFDHENPHSLVTGGPYRYLRHPFYTSYLMFWSGWALASWSAWAAIPVLAFVVIYVKAARKEEKQFSQTALAREYDAYRKRTGFLLPWL